MTDLVIRDLSGMGEFFEAVQLHRDVWGADEPEDPAKLMMVLQDQGGLVAGAFDDECLVGYVFGFMARERVPQDSLAALNWSLRAAERGEPLSYQTLCEIHGLEAVEGPGKSLGVTWCKLAASATVDVKSLGQLEKIQGRLSKGLLGSDLERLQDRAVNWRPLQEKSDEECRVGVERF